MVTKKSWLLWVPVVFYFAGLVLSIVYTMDTRRADELLFGAILIVVTVVLTADAFLNAIRE